MLEPCHPELPLARQCALLGLARSTAYYRSRREGSEDLLLMRLMDEQYLDTPFYGVRRFVDWLRGQGHDVGHDRVRRLMRTLGIEAIYPRPRTGRPAPEHRVYPYLLRGLAVLRPDQVWCADITYVPMLRGFAYLVAVMDWFSRFVLAWRLSNSLDALFCLEALDEALAGTAPEIFNTDQGSQFTARDFTGRLLDAGVRVSMDGRGRCFDNIFIERLWRSAKYEEIYLFDYTDLHEAERRLDRYFAFYNHRRPHQGLGGATPHQVYTGAAVPRPGA